MPDGIDEARQRFAESIIFAARQRLSLLEQVPDFIRAIEESTRVANDCARALAAGGVSVPTLVTTVVAPADLEAERRSVEDIIAQFGGP